MSMTSFAPGQIGVAGHVLVAIGAGFANVNAPRLSELSINITAAIVDGVTGGTSVKTKETQLYSETAGKETLDSRTRTLSAITLFVDGVATQPALDALLAEDHSVGLFIRPFTASGTELAIGDKGDPYNFKVARYDRGSANIGDKWTVVIEPIEVVRGTLGVALVA